jgi:phosphate transport system permease protein
MTSELATPSLDLGFSSRPLSRTTIPAIAVLSLVLAQIVTRVFMGGGSVVATLVIAGPTNLAMTYVVSRRREGSRRAIDRMVTALVYSLMTLALAPLVSVVWTTVDRGLARFDGELFTSTMRSVVGDGGGVKHAIIGTAIITGLAAAMAVPIGLFTGIYLVEYGKKSRLARLVVSMVDVMTGIPSIVAGLFAYALFSQFQGPGARSGFAGSVALAVLMTPIVVRSTQEMLRLVPNELREASYALGVSKWRTIVKVVLPTAVSGLLTGVSLAIARVIGETAPLLIAAGLAQDTNTNPFSGRMTSLPVMSYYGYAAPGFPPEAGYDRGWSAALLLIIIVLVIFSVSRILGRVLRPKGLR